MNSGCVNFRSVRWYSHARQTSWPLCWKLLPPSRLFLLKIAYILLKWQKNTIGQNEILRKCERLYAEGSCLQWRYNRVTKYVLHQWNNAGISTVGWRSCGKISIDNQITWRKLCGEWNRNRIRYYSMKIPIIYVIIIIDKRLVSNEIIGCF